MRFNAQALFHNLVGIPFIPSWLQMWNMLIQIPEQQEHIDGMERSYIFIAFVFESV